MDTRASAMCHHLQAIPSTCYELGPLLLPAFDDVDDSAAPAAPGVAPEPDEGPSAPDFNSASIRSRARTTFD